MAADVSGMGGKGKQGRKCMKIDISIVVVTYNQESTVLQTLESIKYQIEHYHKEETLQLIIADDGSKDKTQRYINNWLKENADLFVIVNKLFSNVNRGTCKNVADAFRQIKGEHILSIAGDDLFMNTNVFEVVMKVQAYEIMACPPLKFRDGRLATEYSNYYNDMIAAFFKETDIRKRSKFSCPITNGGIIGRSFYNEEAYAFSERFVLLDDWTRFVKIFEKARTFKYYYSDEPILLYRLSDLQVTSKHSTARQILDEDVKNISEYVLKEIKNPVTWLRIQMQKLRVVNPRLYQILKFFNVGACWDYFLYHIVKKKKISVMIDNMILYGKENFVEDYLREIHRKADDYMKGM